MKDGGLEHRTLLEVYELQKKYDEAYALAEKAVVSANESLSSTKNMFAKEAGKIGFSRIPIKKVRNIMSLVGKSGVIDDKNDAMQKSNELSSEYSVLSYRARYEVENAALIKFQLDKAKKELERYYDVEFD